ncbi:MAG: DUF2911 domain-containing protein [Fulvivirga sp.]|nr:DUF2911 domain-containing protein [Fulvivirga sp.]
MKKTITILLSIMLVTLFDVAYSQKKASPPASASGEIDGVKIKIDYHQPSARGRDIMGDLVPYGKVWRTGANNATKISFSEDVLIEGEELPKGTYSLFTIPGEDEWTIIFNSKTDIWGTQYDESTDVLRVTVTPEELDQFVETFDISVDDQVVLSWENTMVAFGIEKQ